MTVILDTNVFIWLCREPGKLSSRALGICNDVTNELYLSVASVWEIQIKVQLGKLNFHMSHLEKLKEQNGLELMGIELPHIFGLKNLPSIHSDPFDRIIISQARESGAALLTCDEKIKQYPVNVIW